MKYKKEHWLDLSTYIKTSISCPSRKLPNSVKLRGGWLLLRLRSFKVTDFGTNRKLIYDFLLLINCNLPHILHRFQVMVQFSLARVKCLTLTLSLGVVPYKYRLSDISLKSWFFGLHFRRRKYIFLPLFGLTPRRRGSPGTISVKFYLDVVRSPTYYMA